MALRFAVALAVVVVAYVDAGCVFTPPPPSCPIPGLDVKAALSNLPVSFPCPPVKTKTTQHPDINIPLPLPAEVPLGNYCSCQKYGITPNLVACTPAAPAPAPVVYSAPAPVYTAPAPAPAPVVYSVAAPAPASVVYTAPAPAPAPASVVYSVAAPAPASVVYTPAPAAAPALSPCLINTILSRVPAPKTPSCGCA